MAEDHSFLENPQGTREEIMEATYRALCEYGYADLTIQRIGEHFEKSVSLLYQHHDGKDELLVDFLSFMLEEFERSIPPVSQGDPAEHVEEILNGALAAELSSERSEFESALVELRAQAAHDERYRQQFTEHDRFFRDRLVEVIEAGIEDGTFRDVDPERVATFVSTTIEGTFTLRATSDVEDARAVRAEVEEYLDATLFR